MLGDIFGSGGLILADTEEDYKHRLDELTKKWDALEMAETGKPPKFSRYYRVHKSNDVFHHMTAKVSRDAGFEDKAQTNNVPESGNALLKRWQDFQPSNMSSFVDDVEDLINKQRSDVKKAYLGLHSPYVVRPEYKEHVRSQSDFFDANPGRRAFAGKVLVDPDRHNEVYHYRHVPPRPSGLKEGADPDYDMDIIPDDQLASTKPVAQSKLSRRLFQEDDADDFVGVEFSAGNHSSAASRKSQELTTICSQEQRGTFTGKDLQALSAKATQLIVERSIREGFDAQSHFVKSTSSPNPHTVKSTSPTKYVCDKDCLGYNGREGSVRM